ncbi:alpha/beta hydrolase [Neptunitalea lumnitzerae]|uniref:Alpha/beta hydrolase n=1 Tax=Neptunitalea lumnitzerae TaxID=2965509 RepID=A0ABQ5MKL9_9FLAO|nr:alpha/beta hydrolase [Neptunitalea sp. Y10]GLB49882.1 alpha/beta hydrolase [Neptunitalea sp. Y10]
MSVKKKIPVYFMPGMAANKKIFDHIELPEETYDVHYLEWLIPEKKEPIEVYAKRLTESIKEENPVLIGVSFGGILVQEMANIIKTRKVILISSIKHESEMPSRMHFSRITHLHKLLPTRLVSNIELLAKYAFGETVSDRLELYKMYLSVSDKQYIDWALDTIINWKQKHPVPVVHIQGDNDKVFPIHRIKDCITVKGGTHVMIINRFKWFNEHLPSLITSI